MKCVILQPSYIPWRGYFHQIQKADIFVFYDCVQYDARGWRNRNQIKTPAGLQWLTIPVNSKGAQIQAKPIKDIAIVWDRPWAKKHLNALCNHYGKARFFKYYSPLLEQFYDRRDDLLVDFNCDLTERIARELGIVHTRFIRSSSLNVQGYKSDRLLSILKILGATHYITGPSAENYLDMDKFDKAGITVEFMTYDYPEYPQIHGPFQPSVTILDLLFNIGPDAPKYIWNVQRKTTEKSKSPRSPLSLSQ